MPTEPIANVEAPRAAAPDRGRMIGAYQLRRDLLGPGRGLLPSVGADLSIAWTIAPYAPGPLPSPEELRRIEDLKPEFLQELRDRGVKVPVPRPTPLALEGSSAPAPIAATVPPAPKVPPAKKARVMGMIGGLQTAGGPYDDIATAKAIGDAIGDTKPQSIETFAGYARDVRTGKLPVDALVVAFEAACGKGKTNRGGTLVKRIQRWKEAHPGWSKGRERSPAAVESP